MKHFIFILIAFFFSSANATLISPVSVFATGTGVSFGSPDLLLVIDGDIPVEFSSWNNSSNIYWNDTTPEFTIDLGALYNIDDMLVSVDNNDAYSVQWSTNSVLWNNLFTIDISDGEVWNGMDTMSTDVTSGEYVIGINFTSVQAQYLRISAIDGDNSYSIGEVQAFGSRVTGGGTVPEPSALALFGLGLLGFGYTRRQQKK